MARKRSRVDAVQLKAFFPNKFWANRWRFSDYQRLARAIDLNGRAPIGKLPEPSFNLGMQSGFVFFPFGLVGLFTLPVDLIFDFTEYKGAL